MKHLLYIVAIALVLSACTTTRKVQDESLLEQATPAPAPRVTPVPGTPVEEDRNVGTVAAVEPVNTQNQAPVSTRSETVEVLNNAGNKTYNYYVIIGSFGSETNATNYANQLKEKNFMTNVLKSTSTSFYRVSVGGFNDETEARNLVYKIRQEYPEHKDTWLLKSN